MSRPIISLSLPKSGTTTLADALRQAGLTVADWRIRRHETDSLHLHDRLVAELMYEDYFDSGDPLARLGEFDAITEMNAVNKNVCFWPQMDVGLLSAIEAHHPGVRFLLSRRDPEKTAESMLNWNNLAKERLPRNNVPGLPRPYGDQKPHLVRWITSHYAFCDRLFEGRDHFMAVDPEDPAAAEKISAFLDVDMPWWGKSNTTADWLATQRQDG